MKYLILTIAFFSFLAAANNGDANSDKKSRIEKQLEKQMQKEKKFSKEQKFYQSKNYDLKGAEVNKDSLDSVPELEPEYDFDMDSVYD